MHANGLADRVRVRVDLVERPDRVTGLDLVRVEEPEVLLLLAVDDGLRERFGPQARG
jgi:hypothetical protein